MDDVMWCDVQINFNLNTFNGTTDNLQECVFFFVSLFSKSYIWGMVSILLMCSKSSSLQALIYRRDESKGFYEPNFFKIIVNYGKCKCSKWSAIFCCKCSALENLSEVILWKSGQIFGSTMASPFKSDSSTHHIYTIHLSHKTVEKWLPWTGHCSW